MTVLLRSALHTISNCHRRNISHVIHRKNASDESDKLTDLSDQLSRLTIQRDKETLSLAWLRQAVAFVDKSWKHVFSALADTNCSERERKRFESYLEDALSLLDVCNGLKELLNDSLQYAMLVSYAARIGLDLKEATDNDAKAELLRLLNALHKSVELMNMKEEENGRHGESRSKFETCSSLLRSIGEHVHLCSPRCRWDDFSEADNAMYGAKVAAIFFGNVLALSLTVKPPRRFSLVPIKVKLSWLQDLDHIQQNLKDLTDGCIERGDIFLLKELDAVRVDAAKLQSTVINLCEADNMPPSEADRAALTAECKKLSLEADSLYEGLLLIQRHLDDLFRTLLNVRVGLVSKVCNIWA
ncbi:hypothetical protein KP509_04G039400 [Ceratopteris richardii]|uniref:Uncharacterized protein n=1 Tax=Ceratopteris richardii TaxID=49495 RepID=A0A8T2UZ73_CERRI|nr:hypothetical protein KP509_04G039400 [Ceratopteris richardii]